MGALTRDTPKPLLPVYGRAILARVIDGLVAAGIREVIIVTGYLGEQIEAAFGDGSSLGISIAYRRQERTDGTAAALLLARDLVADAPFLLSWGDIFVDPALYRTMAERFAARPCDVLLSVNPVDDPWRGAAVYVGAENEVERLVEKPPRGTSTTGWNNAGVFVFSSLVLEYAARLQPSSRGEYELPQAIAAMLADGRDIRAVPTGPLWSDVGTPEDLRFVNLVVAFRERYGEWPAAVVAAPGRVNLIGEHTDYNGLPVLPMAIDRQVRMAVKAGAGDEIALENIDPAFGERRYRIAADIEPFAGGDWGNYHKAAVQGLVRHLGPRDWRGGRFLVDGDVPRGAGLSSSSAFVVASGLAFLAANGIDRRRQELADVLARAERYVGTLSGGMDQAASLLAEEGRALRIDFFPLRSEPVSLPEDVAVVVCHSLVEAEKSGGARAAYNTRVIECRLACRAMEKALAAELPRPLARLGDLATLFPERPLASFVEALAAILPDEPLRLSEIAKALGQYPGQLSRSCEVPSDMPDRFAVLRRARHVLREGDRVAAAVAALHGGDAAAFGLLMNDSHASCRDDYEVSCAALDELVEQARAAGALGARLTGAGFGGCTVNLVSRSDVDAFLARIDAGFYRPRLDAGADPAAHRFVFAPHRGATITRLS